MGATGISLSRTSLALCAAASLCACGDSASDSEPGGGAGSGAPSAGISGAPLAGSSGGADHVAADAASIDEATYLADIGNYKAFAKAPGFDTPQASSSPHGAKATVYVNAVLAGALAKTGLVAWPDGSLLVKDSFDAMDAPVMTTVMEKYGSGWYFAQYDPTGKHMAGGLDDSACTGCHAGGNDGVLAFELP